MSLTIPTYAVSGARMAALTPAAAATLVVESAAAGLELQTHLCNAYTLSLLGQDKRLAAALAQAHLNLPDGTPVAWLGRNAGIREPVRGPALVRAVAAQGVKHGLRHYFYGGAPGVARELAGILTVGNPGLVVAGYESPPFSDPDATSMDAAAERIAASGANVVWLGLGTPRQDYVVPLLCARLPVVVVPVGAAFDFLTGRTREAPKMLHGTGLEWVDRLLKEPRRLWPRYLIGNPRFVLSVLRHLGNG